jgi:hypothetical protein
LPRRIPVVVSQSPGGSAARQVEEELVAALLMEPGVDLNVVPHLPHLEGGATGLLCLEGIQGHLVLFSWLAPLDAQSILDGHGLAGRIGRTSFYAPPQAASHLRRTIYHVQLGQQAVPAMIQEIRRIRDDLATSTVSLTGGDLLSGLAAATSQPATSVAGDAPPTPSVTAAPAAQEPAGAASALPESQAGDDDDDHALDRLVNQLDELDL